MAKLLDSSPTPEEAATWLETLLRDHWFTSLSYCPICPLVPVWWGAGPWGQLHNSTSPWQFSCDPFTVWGERFGGGGECTLPAHGNSPAHFALPYSGFWLEGFALPSYKRYMFYWLYLALDFCQPSFTPLLLCCLGFAFVFLLSLCPQRVPLSELHSQQFLHGPCSTTWTLIVDLTSTTSPVPMDYSAHALH